MAPIRSGPTNQPASDRPGDEGAWLDELERRINAGPEALTFGDRVSLATERTQFADVPIVAVS